MATFLFSTLPIEVEKMIVQTATTKKNKVALNNQLNNMRRQFYEDQWHDTNDWVKEKYPDFHNDFDYMNNEERRWQLKQQANFFSNFIKPCRDLPTIAGDIGYHDDGEYFIHTFRENNFDTPILRHSIQLIYGTEDHYPWSDDMLDGRMIRLEDCIWH